MNELAVALAGAAADHEGSSLQLGPPVTSIDAIVAAPGKIFASLRPTFGRVAWQAPPSYRRWLETVGRFSLCWHSPLGELDYDVSLLGAGRSAATVCKLVYAGHGAVADVALSLDHLVPFATGGCDEAAFCFDTTAPGPEYPVFYHHQDSGRFRIAETRGWHPSSAAEPDFPDFLSWVAWLAGAVGGDVDPCEQGLGSPNFAVRS